MQFVLGIGEQVAALSPALRAKRAAFPDLINVNHPGNIQLPCFGWLVEPRRQGAAQLATGSAPVINGSYAEMRETVDEGMADQMDNKETPVSRGLDSQCTK